jgi:hypothetical protein
MNASLTICEKQSLQKATNRSHSSRWIPRCCGCVSCVHEALHQVEHHGRSSATGRRCAPVLVSTDWPVLECFRLGGVLGRVWRREAGRTKLFAGLCGAGWNFGSCLFSQGNLISQDEVDMRRERLAVCSLRCTPIQKRERFWLPGQIGGQKLPHFSGGSFWKRLLRRTSEGSLCRSLMRLISRCSFIPCRPIQCRVSWQMGLPLLQAPTATLLPNHLRARAAVSSPALPTRFTPDLGANARPAAEVAPTTACLTVR